MTSSRLEAIGLRSPHGGPFSFTLQAGECVAVVGRSGSGKSVLMRMLADLDPHQGEVTLDGRARSTWAAPQWRRQVVYQAAEPVWWERSASAHFAGTISAQLKDEADRLGLSEPLFASDIARLSTGERQRMALLRSLACAPAVLLLDEPTASLDVPSVLAVESIVADRLRSGLAALFVTHSREQAARVGHRVLEVRDGELQPS